MKDVFTGVEKSGILDVFKQAWQTGKSIHLPEAFYQGEHEPGSWRENWAYKLEPNYIVAVYNDITERKRLESNVLNYQHQLKEMASRLSRVQEIERRDLSRRLHDGISQKLAMSRLKLQRTAHDIEDAELAENLTGVCDELLEMIEDSYSMMLELSNPVLYKMGLAAAVRSLVESRFLDDMGIRCTFIEPEGPLEIGQDARVVLYQAVRELLMNVGKHARAIAAEVRIVNEPPHLCITVTDDGVGFAPSAESLPMPSGAGGFGLFAIKESLEGIGGKLDIQSRPTKGTCVTITVPLKYTKSK